jgi:hypothetical protein
MQYDIEYVKKKNHREKKTHMPTFLVQLWFLKFFFTSFCTLQILYKKNVHCFDLQDSETKNRRN